MRVIEYGGFRNVLLEYVFQPERKVIVSDVVGTDVNPLIESTIKQSIPRR